MQPAGSQGRECVPSDSLCVVIAGSVTADQYTARPAEAMPGGVPVLTAALGDYPRVHHAAIVHLTYIHDAYDQLPEALALLIDHGDRHAAAGTDICAQAIHIGHLARVCAAGALRGRHAFKSLTPRPALPPAAGSVFDGRDRADGGGGERSRRSGSGLANETAGKLSFACRRHELSTDEKAAWAALLQQHLGPPPEHLHAYMGRGEVFTTREALRSIPRALYAQLLATLLSRSSPHAAGLGKLLRRSWGALLGSAYHRRDFDCDRANGWGIVRRPRGVGNIGGRDDGGMRPLPLLPPLAHTPYATVGAGDASLATAPTSPSKRELATGCGSTSLVCAVVAAHKESLGWLHSLRMPTLTYHRTVSPNGLYVVPNVFHEHAVYLRYICAFYHQLPKLSVFLHGHRTSWHNNKAPPAAEQLRAMNLRGAARAGGVYRSFNDFAQCWRDGAGEWEAEMLAQVYGWDREIRPMLGRPPRLRESYCCTQFIVSADRIRRRPLAFWRQLLADLLDATVPKVCKLSGHVLELTWGYLLGEPANATCRRDGNGA